MDNFEKKYNWEELKSKLNEFEPKDSLWDSITNSLHLPEPEIDFNQSKDQLPVYQPNDIIWDNISSELDAPIPKYDFNQLKDNLPLHTPDSKIWNDISKSLDSPEVPPSIYDFNQVKDQFLEYTPDASIWDAIEDGLELGQKIDQLPSHEPSENIWDKIEEDLEDVKGGISFLRTAIMLGISMLVLVSIAFMLNQDSGSIETGIENPTIQFASNENHNIQWSDDEDVRLIQEMCQDYMAVCEQPKFKELENELLELNDHKKELLQMVSAFDEESTYVPMLAKIEVQKTALMKEMIAMI